MFCEKKIFVISFFLFFYFFTSYVKSFTQPIYLNKVGDSINIIKKSKISDSEKLIKFYLLKTKFEKNNFLIDSVYAQLLNEIGVYEYFINKDYEKAINFTLASIKVYTSGAFNNFSIFRLYSYCNLAYYYNATNLYTKSLKYCDSSIIYSKRIQKSRTVDSCILYAKLIKANIFFHSGDYQKCVEECTLGLNNSFKNKDLFNYLYFLNQRSQSLFFQNQLIQSLKDAVEALQLAKKLNQHYDIATAYKMEGVIYAANRNFSSAKMAFNEAIKERKVAKDNGQVAGDYNDLGNFYTDSVKDFRQAKISYFIGIKYAQKDKDSLRLARINANLGNTFFQENDFEDAQIYCSKSFDYLKLHTTHFFINSTSSKNNLIGNKELIINLFTSKTKLLLRQFHQNNNQAYLTACINTAQVTDSVINETRHEQLGEQSKLYWRNNTRDFYANALEACYLANNAGLAFFFMEKSRAVLLNDKLNELGASLHLPTSEAEKEDSLRSNIVQQEQQLANLKEGTKAYETQQMKLLNAKADFENYIRSLEQKFPVYYQYKYNDSVPNLQSLQQFLKKTTKLLSIIL